MSGTIDSEPGRLPNIGPTHPGQRLRESLVGPALDKLDWNALRLHLEETGLEDATLTELLDHVRQTNSLIMPYPNEKREQGRTEFFRALEEHVRLARGTEKATAVVAELSLIVAIERGYRGILTALAQSAIAQLPVNQRVAACIRRAAIQFTLLHKQFEDAVRARKEVSLPHGPLLMREDRTFVSADAAIQGLVDALTITLQMEAHTNGWFDRSGAIVLPTLPTVDEEQVYKAETTEVLAALWQRWRDVEQRRRFIGGTFEELVAPGLPPALAPQVERLTIYHPDPDSFELIDYIANARLSDRLGQNFATMLMQTNVEVRAVGIHSGAALLPAAFVSATEANAAVALSETLSYSIADDKERPGGLRFVGWLRGYAVLSVLAEERAGAAMENPVFTIPRVELLALLESCGLTDGAAAQFIDRVTLNKSSRDMFDTPLIRMADGALLVFGPGLIHADPARIVLSMLSTLNEPLARKGKAFERDILEFLKKKGLKADAFKVNRDGEEYEYDVVLVWGDYVFVFECKNHALSNYHPIQAYRFEQEIRSNRKQVSRLADALRRYPDILVERMSVDVAEKTIVPCVLNALPYAYPGPVDGVYVFDASALKRFFEEQHFRLITPYRISEKFQVLHRVAMRSAWAGDTPTPEDLLRQLEEPFQVALTAHHIEVRHRSFPAGASHLVAAPDFYRTEITLESFAELTGASAETIRRGQADVAQRVRTLKTRLERPD